MHHRHPPTGWSRIEGPLRPRAFDLMHLEPAGEVPHASPWHAPEVLSNAHLRLRFWRLAGPMPALARNADGDELLFVHAARAICTATTGGSPTAPATTCFYPAAPCGAWRRPRPPRSS